MKVFTITEPDGQIREFGKCPHCNATMDVNDIESDNCPFCEKQMEIDQKDINSIISWLRMKDVIRKRNRCPFCSHPYSECKKSNWKCNELFSEELQTTDKMDSYKCVGSCPCDIHGEEFVHEKMTKFVEEWESIFAEYVEDKINNSFLYEKQPSD
jgi:hypothetical protein